MTRMAAHMCKKSKMSIKFDENMCCCLKTDSRAMKIV